MDFLGDFFDSQIWGAHSAALNWVGEKRVVSYPCVLKLENSHWQKKRRERSEGRLDLFEKQILGKDKRQSVIFLKLNVTEEAQKGMDSKDRRREKRVLCEEKGKKGQNWKRPWRGRGGKETEGLFSSGWTSKSLTVLWITSLSCWIWGSTNQKERKIKGRAKESSGRGRCIIPPSWSWRRWRGCAGRCGGAANRSDNMTRCF